MIIERELYGLKNYGDTYRGNLSETLMLLGYKSSEADANIWMNGYFNPNGNPYYKYMLCYVEEWLQIGLKPREDMDALNMIY